MRSTRDDTATIARQAVEIFEDKWENLEARMCIVPGKNVLARLREEVSQLYGVSLTDHRIVSEFAREEVPTDLRELLEGLDRYRQGMPP